MGLCYVGNEENFRKLEKQTEFEEEKFRKKRQLFVLTP